MIPAIIPFYMNLSTKQIRLMFGLIGSGFTVQDHNPENVVTLVKTDEKKLTTKIVLIPNQISNEKTGNQAVNAINR